MAKKHSEEAAKGGLWQDRDIRIIIIVAIVFLVFGPLLYIGFKLY